MPAGATGGFAAGERGLKQYLRDGTLQIRKEGQPGVTQYSPVPVAWLLVLGGAGGGLLLNSLADVAEQGIKTEIVNVRGRWHWLGEFIGKGEDCVWGSGSVREETVQGRRAHRDRVS